MNNQDNSKEIEKLIEDLVNAAQVYYQGTAPLMSDSDYDSKITYLRKLVINDSLYKSDPRVQKLLEGDVAGGSEPEGELVTHTSPMLSLGKSNSFEDIKNYVSSVVEKGNTGFTLQAKLDGYAISAIYKDGLLTQISTRGDGSIGQNMSYLIDNSEVTIKGLPKVLDTNDSLELRGELFLRNSQFNQANIARQNSIGGTFKNSRNAVVGITKKAEQGLGYHVELTFSVYTLLIDNVYTNLDYLHQTESNLILVDSLTVDEWTKNGGEGELSVNTDLSKIFDKINKFGELRPKFDIPTDGVVLKPYDEAYFYETMGHTVHHPLAFTAFKYPAITKDTKVLAIVTSVGKTGRLTPKAIIEPVNILGTTIQRVTCNNFNWLYEKNIRVGSVVSVGRSNDVIPKIMNVIIPGDTDLPKVPTECPECGTKLVSSDDETPAKTLKCPNANCPSRLFYLLKSVVGKQALDIDGLNNVYLKALIESGNVYNIESLFALDETKISKIVIGKTQKGNPKKLGKIRAKKIIEAIEDTRTHTPAYKMLNSLGFLNLGPATSKKLLSICGSIKAVLDLTPSQLENIDGFGDVKSEQFINQRESAKQLYKNLVARGVTMNKPEKVKSLGKSFSITGIVPDGFSNRAEFVKHMESLGWKFDSTPNKDTDFMFGDKTSTSSKMKKALSLNIPIVTSINEI